MARLTRALVSAGLIACLALAGGLAVGDTGTRITGVYPAGQPTEGVAPVPSGEPVVVAGVTVLQPDANAVTVDLRDAEGDLVAAATTESWGQDGVWRVRLETTGVPPGTYTVEVNDGYETRVETVRVVEPTPTATPTRTSPSPTGSASATAAPSTTARGAGFGVGVTLVALVGLATVAAGRGRRPGGR